MPLPLPEQPGLTGHPEAPGLFRWFIPAARGRFLARPNRFVALVEIQEADGRTTVATCHCPNPGRLGELLYPGTPVLLEAAPPGRQTPWTLAAVCHQPLDGSPACVVPVHSARANQAVARLVLPRLFPDALAIRPEHSLGHSRFDFLVTRPPAGGLPPGAAPEQHLVEVKCCTEVEFGTALFPDAPSDRATRHLEELARLAAAGWHCHVVFAVTHGQAACLRPNLHTDPVFAATAAAVAGPVAFHAVEFRLDETGQAWLAESQVPVDLAPAALARENRGSYLMLLELPEAVRLAAGALGELDYPAGWYVYAGSARKNLRQRMARHARRTRKARHWHLDWLTPHASRISSLGIAGLENRECALAAGLQALGGRMVPGFGCSDCRCPSHLYHFEHNPEQSRDFQRMLMAERHGTPPVR